MQNPETPVTLRRLTVGDAAVAARLHEAGQPGTVLTSLGMPFLRVLYAGFATANCYATVAERDRVVGVIIGARDTGKLYREMFSRQWARMAVAAALGLVRRPALWPVMWQALRYPHTVGHDEGVGEFLFIGVDPAERRSGIGSLMLDDLVRASKADGLKGLFLTVDVNNAAAIRFHERHGFRYQRTAILCGRPMHYYRLEW